MNTENDTPSSILFEAKRWSELPDVLRSYEASIDAQDAISRLFGYASLIKQHTNEKPEGSHSIPNEKARLPGMEVAMNVLAAGQYEFRGTRDTYKDAQNGDPKAFANVGIYAGLERASSKDGFAEGMNITAGKEDRHASIIAYIKRELGNPPEGISLDDIFNAAAAPKFEALKGTPQDNFGMYKFQIVNADIDAQGGQPARKVPAITVSTNEESDFSAIGLSPHEAALRILDGQGYARRMGQASVGGTALDYFKDNVIAVARELGLHQPRLEAINIAVEELSHAFFQIHGVISQSLPYEQEATLIDAIVKANLPDNMILASPHFHPGQNVNERAPVSDEDKALPQNQMPHTAAEKFANDAKRFAEGKTGRGR